MNSLIIPVYKNELNIPSLLSALEMMYYDLEQNLEVVFVVDGSPDSSYNLLNQSLSSQPFQSKLISLAKNFGSFAAIRVGLEEASGDYFAVMAADLQEPPELIIEFFQTLKEETHDVVIGTRNSRNDPLYSKYASNIFWYLYKKFVIKDMPSGGIDVFGCNKLFRNKLLELKESHSSLIAQIFWLGFRRKEILYDRKERQLGVSAWTFRKKINYMMDSIFSFTDLPIKILIRIGIIGTIIFGIVGVFVFISKLLGLITVPGYASTFLAIGFFGTLNLYGIGIVGLYSWRIYENTKQRPLSIILDSKTFKGN